MQAIQNIQNNILLFILIVQAVLLFACLVRAVLGPSVADRLVAVNMMGTIVIVMIASLAIMLDEGYLVDISIIYAMMSFLAVIVLAKIYIGVYEEKKYDVYESNTNNSADDEFVLPGSDTEDKEDREDVSNSEHMEDAK